MSIDLLGYWLADRTKETHGKNIFNDRRISRYPDNKLEAEVLVKSGFKST